MSEIHGEEGKEAGRGKSFCSALRTARFQYTVKLLQHNSARKHKRLSDTCQWANFQNSSATEDKDVARVKIQREKQLHFTPGTPVCPALRSQSPLHAQHPGDIQGFFCFFFFTPAWSLFPCHVKVI